jgi:hypothetical protein
MKVNCVSCGYEINLDHKVFYDYEGSVKCFSCGSMMRLQSRQGQPCSIEPLFTLASNNRICPDSIMNAEGFTIGRPC